MRIPADDGRHRVPLKTSVSKHEAKERGQRAAWFIGLSLHRQKPLAASVRGRAGSEDKVWQGLDIHADHDPATAPCDKGLRGYSFHIDAEPQQKIARAKRFAHSSSCQEWRHLGNHGCKTSKVN